MTLKYFPLGFLMIARFTIIKNIIRICRCIGMCTFCSQEKVHNFHYFLGGTYCSRCFQTYLEIMHGKKKHFTL